MRLLKIYRRIVQMGVTRAGWYSYDLLDNLARRSAESILPEHQNLQVGDLIPMSPDGKQGMWVKDFSQNKWMLWWDKRGDSSWVWQIYTGCGPIEYAALGEGPPVLVLHGTSGGWDQGISAARGLVSHGFQIIAPSRFGYLGTPLPPDPLPPAEADAWICFLDALKIQRVPVISYSAGAAPAIQLALRHPDRISAEIFFVPGSGGICPECIEEGTNPPRWLLDALYRFDFPMWLVMKLAPKFRHTLVAVPSSLVPTLSSVDRAELNEAIKIMLPVSPRRLGVLNEGNTQGTQIQ
jgi:hypothetical protein